MNKGMIIPRAVVLITVFILLSASFSIAEEPLSWTECVRKAKEDNPELVSAKEDIKQAQSDKGISLSAILPQVDTDASVKRTKSSGAKRSDTYSYGISGRQLVFDGFKTASDMAYASKIISAQEYNYALASSDIRLNLRKAFISLLRAQELVGITENIAKRRKQNFELVSLRYKGGREHKGALLTAEADLAQAEFEVGQAKRSIFLASRELAKQLGGAYSIPLQAEGTFLLQYDYDDYPDMEYIADTTPFLRALIAKKDAALYDVNSKQSEFMPKVYLDGAFGRQAGNWPPGNDEWSTGLSVSLPVFEGGKRFLELSKAESRLNQSVSDIRSGRDTVLVTLEGSWKDLKDAIANVSVQEKFLMAAEERAKITRVQYSTGLATFNDWIIIEDNLVKAQKAHINSQADMLSAEAYWIQAIGGTLEYDKE